MARIHAFRSGRSGLLIILKDKLAIEEMPDLLKRMWWKIVCMKWPNDEQPEDMEVFWQNFKKHNFREICNIMIPYDQ